MKVQKNRLLWFIMFIIFLTGCGQADVFTSATDGADTDAGSQMENTAEGRESTTEISIYVYVCGHVNQPGVYQLSANSRICDAITLAGGITEDGNGEVLNQAEHMTDGQTLYVPGYDENYNEQTVQDDGLLNINTAGKEEFMTLPGIGEAKADTIIQYREEHGAFKSVEELMNIPGIKEGVFNKIKSSIKVS